MMLKKATDLTETKGRHHTKSMSLEYSQCLLEKYLRQTGNNVRVPCNKINILEPLAAAIVVLTRAVPSLS